MAGKFKRLEDLGRGSYKVQDEKGDVFAYNENSGNKGPVEYNVFSQGESLETSPRDFSQGPANPNEIVSKMAELYGTMSALMEGREEVMQNAMQFRNETPSLPTPEEAFPMFDYVISPDDIDKITPPAKVKIWGGAGVEKRGIKGTVDDIMTMGKTFKGMVTEGINKAVEIWKYPSTPEEIEEWNSIDKMLEDDARNKRIEKYRRYGKGMGFSDESYEWKNRDRSNEEEI